MKDTLFIYFHGFSSGPHSNKARAFRQHFSSLDLPLVIPDLEDGDFMNLSITSQINVIRRTFQENPAGSYGLIGSSMGGYLAALTAQLQPLVHAVYLMCPGFHFVKRWKIRLLAEYPYTKEIPRLIPLLNYRYNKIMDFSTAIFDDAAWWENVPLNRRLPTRLVHGIHDDIVGIDESRSFTQSHPWAQLEELDSDHGLLSHVDWILQDCIGFFRSQGLIVNA